MVTRATILLAVLLLLLSGGYLAVDRQLAELVRSELQTALLHEMIEFRELHVEPFDHAVVRGATLRDPQTGRRVAHVDELFIDIELDFGWDGVKHFDVAGLRGRGGQALLSVEDGTLVLARAIHELIQRINSQLPEHDPDAPPQDTPPMTFEDVDILVHAEGQALDRFFGTTVRILDVGSEILLQIHTGQGEQVARRAGRRSTLVAAGGLQEGEVQIVFAGDGEVLRIESRRVQVSPALLHIEPDWGSEIAREFAPRGLLDMIVQRDPDGAVSVTGTLRDGRLSIPILGLDLHPQAVPFRVINGVGTVHDAEMDFAGGTAVVSLADRPGELEIKLRVRDADFREEFLAMVPVYKDLGVLSCEDGGQFELDLEMLFRDGQTLPDIHGGGGFHILEAKAETPIGPLSMQDVVGSFRVANGRLEFPEVSARVASGVVRGQGDVAANAGSYEAVFFVEDVDLAQLDEQLQLFDREDEAIGGWLQAKVELAGTPGVANTFAGQASFSVRAGDLWDTPLLEAILLAMPLGDQSTGGRQSVEARLTLFSDRASIDALRIVSDLFTLEGAGSIGWDGRLDLQFVPVYPLGLLGQLIQTIQQEIVANLRVEGRIDQPRVMVVPFDVLTSRLREAVRRFLADPEPPPEAPEGAGPGGSEASAG